MLRLLPLALLLTPLALAGNWPAWRGPTGNGHTPEKDLPLTWSATENVRWKLPLPESGSSTPIIWGDSIFLTQATEKGQKRSLWCISRKTGKKVWEKTVTFKGDEPTHSTSPYCAASPVTDGKNVVVWHGSAGVYCYDFKGKELWNVDLGKCLHIWGNASSPVIYKDTVILNFGPGERTFLIALALKDGKQVWKEDQPGGKMGAKGEAWIGSWSTPVIEKIGDRDELIVSWPGVLKAHDPRTGKELWTCKGLAKDKGSDRLVYTTPLVSRDVVVALAGYGGPGMAVKPGGKGDVTDKRLWRQASAQQRIGSGVLIGEHAFILNEPGGLQITDWKTGKVVETKRLTGTTWGSLVHAGDRIYVTSKTGETAVMEAKVKGKILAKNDLKETTQASIAVSDGELFIRTFKHLWCIGKKKE